MVPKNFVQHVLCVILPFLKPLDQSLRFSVSSTLGATGTPSCASTTAGMGRAAASSWTPPSATGAPIPYQNLDSSV